MSIIHSQAQLPTLNVEDSLTFPGTGVLMPQRPSSIQVVFAWLRLWCFRLVKLLTGVGYIAIITDGLRMVVPALGLKLYKLPLLGNLREYEGWHRLDLALPAGMLLFALSNSLWCALLERWLYHDPSIDANGAFKSNHQKCLTVLGFVILFSDACLFYRAMTFVGWGGQPLSLTALICTLTYMAVLVALCSTSVNLKRIYLSLKHRRRQGVES
jgi:hypothetical protein